MRMTMNILYALTAAAVLTLAIPTPGNEPSLVTDIIKRQPPGKYQNANIDLMIYGGAIISLGLVWDCINAAFIAETRGAGPATTALVSQTGETLTYRVTVEPDGEGALPPESQYNPTGAVLPFFFGRQPISVDFQAYPNNDDNTIEADPARWMNPNVINEGPLTVTDSLTHRTTRATVRSFTIGEPYPHDPNNPPSADGSGFDSDSDMSSTISHQSHD